MDKINKIEAVTERDIDLLLLEELNVSDEFSSWIYRKITDRYDIPQSKGAWHSICDVEFGESDLIAIYENGVAILFENKIDAIAQPDQGKRYKARGAKGIHNGLWSRFFTCMVAPKLYLEKEQDAGEYDANLSYEEICSWFSSVTSDRRSGYKSYLIKEAIEQNRRGYTVNPNEKVTEFWLKYWEFSIQRYPELEMKRPNIKPANSDWPDFRPSVLNKRLLIVHKLGRGDVDLQIAGASNQLEHLQDYLSDFDVEVAEAGKSAAIRIKVDPIDRFASFESQKKIAIKGLDAAVKLLKIGRKIGKEI